MKLENLEGILEGKWEIKNKYFHYKLNGEKIIFRGCLLVEYMIMKLFQICINSEIF